MGQNFLKIDEFAYLEAGSIFAIPPRNGLGSDSMMDSSIPSEIYGSKIVVMAVRHFLDKVKARIWIALVGM